MALTGNRVFVRSRSGMFLTLGPPTTGADYGPTIVQAAADANAVWLMRWPFDRGGTKGPVLDNVRWPSSPTTSTNFNLVHEKTGYGLIWRDSRHRQLRGGRYVSARGPNGPEDNSDSDYFNCRRDVLANDANGYSYFALNNSDRSLVADLNAGTPNVGAWEWDGSDKQVWQFVQVGGNPI